MTDSPAPDPTWVTVRIRVAREATGAVEEFLWTLEPGTIGQIVQENEAELRVTLPVPVADGIEGHIAGFVENVDLVTPVTVDITPFREMDWINSYRQDFEPIFVGERLVVAPTWWAVPLPTDRTIVHIDPQMAFGTGHHPTTRACLEWLVRRTTALGERPGGLIDAGCGSGLLAIAGHHLGFTPVAAIDNDPIACATARRNAGANGSAAITVLDGDLARMPLPTVPSLVANLTASAIITLFPRLAAHVAEDGELFLAGILAKHEAQVTAALAHHPWQVVERAVDDGWLTLALRSRE